MKHQLYFPARHAEQLAWLRHFRHQLPLQVQQLETPPAPDQYEQVLRDLDALIYCMGELMPWVRTLSKATTQMQRALLTGDRRSTVTAMPVLNAPPPPADLPRAGALKRVFNLAQIIKHLPGYNEAMGKTLGIVGNHYLQDAPVPVFTLKVLRGEHGEMVRGKFKRFGHPAVAVETRRGNGPWEKLGLGIFARTQFVDARPLLTPGVPEVREYRLRFWGDDSRMGDWSPVASATVSP